MKYLLDTNICIHYFKGHNGVMKKIEKLSFENVAISEITLAELYYGVEKSRKRETNLGVIERFASKITIIPIFNAIRIYAKEKARLKQKGSIISDFDLLIGATALANNMIMVTRNVREFDRIENAQIENWIDE
jgi:tRNA(fMet)-specific endonuclease VapC